MAYSESQSPLTASLAGPCVRSLFVGNRRRFAVKYAATRRTRWIAESALAGCCSFVVTRIHSCRLILARFQLQRLLKHVLVRVCVRVRVRVFVCSLNSHIKQALFLQCLLQGLQMFPLFQLNFASHHCIQHTWHCAILQVCAMHLWLHLTPELRALGFVILVGKRRSMETCAKCPMFGQAQKLGWVCKCRLGGFQLYCMCLFC